MLELNAKTTALVVIDLQEGILPFAGGPHTCLLYTSPSPRD